MALKDVFTIKNPIKGFIQSKVDAAIKEHNELSAYHGNYHNLTPIYFDGEKTPYELGNPYAFDLDYYSVRLRSWELFLKTDFVQNAIKKYCLWVVGAGLKLQSEPQEKIIQNNGINISENQLKDFVQLTESSFRSFANSRFSSFSANPDETLHDLACEALKNAIMSGDCLCITRFDGNRVNLQVVDGGSVCNPIGTPHMDAAQKRGNVIINGVEIDKKGSHVAFYVYEGNQQYIKILSKQAKTGRLQAWLMYGLKGKTKDVRGMSLLTAIIETASKMDRYKDATLGSAEENAKVAYTIEHGMHSDGENPALKALNQSLNAGKVVAPETVFEQCEGVADKVAASTSKQVYNMPVDAKLVKHASGSDVNFGAYWEPNIEVVYSTIGIPPEVAADKFGGAYSGSRAALKAWEYKMKVDRVSILKRQFYHPFYSYWLDIAAFKNKVSAPGYLMALKSKNFEVLEAYRNNRFIGANVPHIDPVKEVEAERRKLGSALSDMPLTDAGQSMENLGTGDYDKMIKKVENEKELAKNIIDSSEPAVE